MKLLHDENLITESELEGIISSHYDDPVSYMGDERGAGSFCKFVKVNGKEYALLTQRAEKLTFNCLRNVMEIINTRRLPAAILGAGMNIKTQGDYMIVMPKVAGTNLPSYVYSPVKNTELAVSTSSISQEAMNTLAAESLYLNDKFISIDFHGANFLWQKENDTIKMLDLKKRGMMKEEGLLKRFIRLMAVSKIYCFNKPGMIEKIKNEQGIDLNKITNKNACKSYYALLKNGIKEENVARALKIVFDSEADIDKLAK